MLGTEITQNRIFGTIGANLDGEPVSPYMFDSNNERGAINSMFIRNISFNQARGGTLTLGGIANGNGYGQILDGSGGTVVTMGSAGINVYGGNINIYDSSGGTVIDSLGLNSASNFYSDAVTGGTVTTTSDSLVSIAGGTLSTLVLPRDTKCLIYMAANGRNDEKDGGVSMRIYDTYYGTTLTNMICNFAGIWKTYVDYDGSGHITDEHINIWNQLASIMRIFDLPAGTHTMNLQYRRTDTAGTAIVVGWELGLVQLGD